MPKFVCPICGWEQQGDNLPSRCPICNGPFSKFKEQVTMQNEGTPETLRTTTQPSSSETNTVVSVLDYLKQVAKMQKELIILQNSINVIDREYPKLGLQYQVKQPSGSNPYKESRISKFFTHIFLWIFYTVLLAIPFALVLGILYGIFDFRLPILRESPILRFFVTDIIISCILAIPVERFCTAIAVDSNKRKWDNYNTQLAAQERRIEQEKTIKQQMIPERQLLQEKYDETFSILQRLYQAQDNGRLILYPKYRDIVSVTMFIEYLDSRRCSQLEGHEGAYNIYENELRLNLIITKLDAIMKQLEAIRQNQYYLYQTLNEVNRKSELIYQELRSVSANTQTMAFYSEIAASNTAALAMIEGFRVMKYGV